MPPPKPDQQVLARSVGRRWRPGSPGWLQETRPLSFPSLWHMVPKPKGTAAEQQAAVLLPCPLNPGGSPTRVGWLRLRPCAPPRAPASTPAAAAPEARLCTSLSSKTFFGAPSLRGSGGTWQLPKSVRTHLGPGKRPPGTPPRNAAEAQPESARAGNKAWACPGEGQPGGPLAPGDVTQWVTKGPHTRGQISERV